MLHRLILLFCIGTGLVRAESAEGTEWLEKMSHAMKNLNYQGTVAFMKNGQLDTMKYIHAAKDGVEQERLLSLNSPMREVIRDSGTVSCTFKDTQKRVVNHRPVSQSFILDLPSDIGALSQLYQIGIDGEASVAMRPAHVIEIAPRDAFRYRRKIWVDQERALPLKVEVYDLNGVVLEQVVFTDISVMQPIPFARAETQDGEMEIQHIHRVQSEPFEKASFALNFVPAGFRKVFFTRMSMHKSDRPIDHLLLSDGFSSISVYLDDKNEDMESGLHTVGSVNSFTRTIDNAMVTVMGEVPAKTVELIARGVRFTNP